MFVKLRLGLFSFILFTSVNQINAQQLLKIKPDSPIICYQSDIDHPFYLPPSNNSQNTSGRVKTANFEVEYINFPANAKTAFDFAVSIWEQKIESPITITIRAQWGSLGSGVLGQAIWGTAFANFDNAPYINTFYPVALAEKISGKELNPTGDADIEASFNSTTSWYFGTNGSTPAGQTDLVTVVLHEIAHGLGFTDTYSVSGANGSVGLANGGQAVPFTFDLFVENGANKNFFTQVASPSTEMKTLLSTNSVFFDGPMARGGNGGDVAKLYAPSPFDNGSSISHLDENTYNPTANSLMTPQIATKEAIHDPGPIVMGIFSDIGWVFTRIVHTPLKDTERKDGAPYVVNAKIESDNGCNAASLKLFYTENGTTFQAPIVMTPLGNNQFSANLPGTTNPKTYGYYISVDDDLNRTFTNPGKVQTSGAPPVQQLNYIKIGPDTDAPVITHTPIDYVFEDTPSIEISATVTDNLGVDEVVIEYLVREIPQTPITMAPGPGENEYSATIPLPGDLVIDDKIEYRIVAKDQASNPNLKTSPESDYHVVFVTGFGPTQDSYANDFDEATTDFIGNTFTVSTITGFDNGAIHSKHPYDNGTGSNNESNYIYQLQIPIRLNAENPYILFDEVVLIEPGESGSVFGDDDFFDYVIVEGSDDLGQSWHAFSDGYDARADEDWLSKWNADVVSDNSESTGDKSLFKRRGINMLESGAFAAGDEVIIRFRLFADAAAYGWGWAIDNLFIQDVITGIETSSANAYNIFPSPVREKLTVETAVINAQNPIGLKIMSLHGQIMHTQTINADRTEIDVTSFSEGIYIMHLQSRVKTEIRKFVKIK
jgi:hypothetical protein